MGRVIVAVLLALWIGGACLKADVISAHGEVWIVYSERGIGVAVDEDGDRRAEHTFTFYRAMERGKFPRSSAMRRVKLESASVEFYGDHAVVTSAQDGFALELSVKGLASLPMRPYPKFWRVERLEGIGLGHSSGGPAFRLLEDQHETEVMRAWDDEDLADWWHWWFGGGRGGGGGWWTVHDCTGGGPGASSCSISCGLGSQIGGQTKSITCGEGLYACCRCDFVTAVAYCVAQP